MSKKQRASSTRPTLRPDDLTWSVTSSNLTVIAEAHSV
jgi:hypothetical protein